MSDHARAARAAGVTVPVPGRLAGPARTRMTQGPARDSMVTVTTGDDSVVPAGQCENWAATAPAGGLRVGPRSPQPGG